MKKIVIVLFLFYTVHSVAQSTSVYTSWGLEWILSKTENNASVKRDIPRFTVWFNAQSYWHYDLNKNIGLAFGVGLKNIGYISEIDHNNVYTQILTHWDSSQEKYLLNQNFSSTSTVTKIKRRTYVLDIPLLFKVGNLQQNMYLFLGGSVSIPFHYKEKVWIDDSKESIKTEWFSERTNNIIPSVFVGAQFPSGMSIKFLYYIRDMMNTSYVENDREVYSDLHTRIFYISIGMYLHSAQKSLSQLKEE